MNNLPRFTPSSISEGISWIRAFLNRLTLKRDLLISFLIGLVSGTFMLIRLGLVILGGLFYLSYAVELLPPAYPIILK